MGRRRNEENKDIPENLYKKEDKRVHKIYWQYKDPRADQFGRHKFHSLGTDKAQAFEIALSLNAAFAEARLNRINQILDRNPKVITQLGVTVKSYCDRYMQEVERRYRSEEITFSSFREKKRHIAVLSSRLGSKRIKEVTVKDIALILEEYIHEDKMTTARQLRSAISLFFKEAQYSGDVDPGFNPASSTRPVKVEVKRSRLPEDDFFKILEASTSYRPGYIHPAIKIAVTTGLRRTDISNLMFRDVQDGHLLVATSKSRKKLVIAFPLAMRSPLLDQSLGDIIAECRRKIVSHYIVHFQDRGARVKIGAQVDPKHLSTHFAALVKLTDISWDEDRTPPTFHELRSLSAQSYIDANDFDEVQNLLGHSNKQMTEKYLDKRTAQKIIYVKVG